MRNANPELDEAHTPCGDNPGRGPLIVVSGPSGVGKTTVVEGVQAQSKRALHRAVTATTRAERPGEVDGKSYHFWSREAFQSEVAKERMLEWEVVHGKDYYGTPRDEVDPYRARGVGVILVIDVKGAATIRKRYPGDLLSVFISAPIPELERRLRARGAESEEKIQRRLRTAEEEIARAGEFDRVIENRDLEQTVAELAELLELQFRAVRTA